MNKIFKWLKSLIEPKLPILGVQYIYRWQKGNPFNDSFYIVTEIKNGFVKFYYKGYTHLRNDSCSIQHFNSRFIKR